MAVVRDLPSRVRGYPGNRRARAPSRGLQTVRPRHDPTPGRRSTSPTISRPGRVGGDTHLAPPGGRFPLRRFAGGSALAAIALVDWLDGIRDAETYRNGFAGFYKYAAREPLTVPPPWGQVRGSSPWPSFFNDSDLGWLNQQYISYYDVVPASQPGFGVWVAVEDVQYGPPSVTFGWQYEDWRRYPGVEGDVELKPQTAPLEVPTIPWQMPRHRVDVETWGWPEQVPYRALPKLRPAIDEVPGLERHTDNGTVPASVPVTAPAWVPLLSPPYPKGGIRVRPGIGLPFPGKPNTGGLAPPPSMTVQHETVLQRGSATKTFLRREHRSKTKEKEKERKTKAGHLAGKAWALIGTITEALDMLDILYKALPPKLKRSLFEARGYRAPTQLEKAQELYDHWEEVDVDRAWGGFVENLVEDFAYGLIGEATGRASARTRNGPIGYGTGLDNYREVVGNSKYNPISDLAKDAAEEYAIDTDLTLGEARDIARDYLSRL